MKETEKILKELEKHLDELNLESEEEINAEIQKFMEKLNNNEEFDFEDSPEFQSDEILEEAYEAETEKEAKKLAEEGMKSNEGGPFGAIIVDKEGNIISQGNNKVLKTKDPTAHAEITAIREACKKLNTYDLSEYILYTSCEPCPMCISAIIWSNIKKVYYGCTRKDAGEIGFRDDSIYEYLKGENKELIELKEIDRKECLESFKKYKENNGIIY